MDKLRTSPADAICDLPDGASIAVSGFGPSAGAPFSLLAALNERGTRNLCFVGNTIPPGAQALVEAGRVRHLIVSFTARAGGSSPAEELMRKGEVTFELVPQGTLVERLRAAGAGLAAVYTPTGLGTPIADGKEVRYFDGKPYLLETISPRLKGHSVVDPARYRTKEEKDALKAADPLAKMALDLEEAGILSHEDRDRLDGEVTAEVDEAAKFADESPEPDVSTLFDYTYATPVPGDLHRFPADPVFRS